MPPRKSNLRLAAVRRLAYEASDAGLLSPDLAAGIRRVKRAKEAVSDSELGHCGTGQKIALSVRPNEPGGVYAITPSSWSCSGATSAERNWRASQSNIYIGERATPCFPTWLEKECHVQAVPVPPCVFSAVQSWLETAHLIRCLAPLTGGNGFRVAASVI